MSQETDGPVKPEARPSGLDRTDADRVPCPNCCRLAPVISRRMGLLFYRCDLCETVGATPEAENSERT